MGETPSPMTSDKTDVVQLLAELVSGEHELDEGDRASVALAMTIARKSAFDGEGEGAFRGDRDAAALMRTLGTALNQAGSKQPPVVTVRVALELWRGFMSAKGAPWFAAMLLRDHPDEREQARNALAFAAARMLGELADPKAEGNRFDLARAVLADEAEKKSDELARLARDDRSALELAKAIAPHAGRLLGLLALDARASRALDGSAPLWLDEALADYLDGLGGKAAKEGASLVRGKADERARAYEADSSQAVEWLKMWLPGSRAEHARAARMLARVVWLDEVGPALSAPPHRVEAVSVAGDHYAKMPKVVAPASWSFGAPGIAAVEVDGNAYAETPTLAKLIPRTWALLPADHARRPHQTVLALELGEAEALPVMVADAQGYVLSPQAAKLALVMLASEGVRRGGLHAADVKTLTRWTRPETRRLQGREYKATAEAVEELNRLWLYLPDETRVKLFDLQLPRTPEAARPDMVLRWGLSGTLRAALADGIRGPMLVGHEYNGEFLINLTGAMRLPNKEPALIRYYMRAAADWNNACSAGSFDPERVKAHTREEWAVLANALPRGAAEYLAAKKGHRAAASSRRAELSKARSLAAEHVERLAEEYGLAKLEKVGRDRFRLLPTREYLEARDKARAKGGGFRPVEPPTLSTRKPPRKGAK